MGAGSKFVLKFEAGEIGVVGTALESPAGEEGTDHKLRAEAFELDKPEDEVHRMAQLPVPAGASDAALRDAALADEKVRAALEGRTVRKVIVVPGKLVNFVVR